MSSQLSLATSHTECGLMIDGAKVETGAIDAAPRGRRLASLDAFRGFIMLCIIGDYAVMHGLESLGGSPIVDAITRQLTHSTWQGLRFEDVIWPCFMLMVGVSAILLYSKRAQTQTRREMFSAVAKRATILSCWVPCVNPLPWGRPSWMLSPLIPIIMKMWTPTYGLASAGFACLLFLVFYLIFDVLGLQRLAFPLVVVGMNALTIYMLGESDTVISFPKIVDIFTGGLAAHLGAFGLLFQALAVLTVEWLFLFWMYKKKIFLTA